MLVNLCKYTIFLHIGQKKNSIFSIKKCIFSYFPLLLALLSITTGINSKENKQKNGEAPKRRTTIAKKR